MKILTITEDKNPMPPLISVAIITYNQKDFLKECVDSVLAQEYLSKEIIISDDCSTDGTIELLRKYQNEHPGLIKILLSEKNKGITANSNSALSACQGKYIALIAGDDLMLPTKLQKQIDYMERNLDCSLCFHDVEYLSSEATGITYCNSKFKNPENLSIDKLIEINFIPAASIMFRRSNVPKHGFDSRLPTVSDWLLSIETTMNGKMGYIDEVLGQYRRHSHNISNNYERCFPDVLFTLAIIDSKWPDFCKNTRRARSNFYCSFGFRRLRNNEKKLGRKLLWESYRLNYFNWKSVACLFLSLFSANIIKKLFETKKVNKIKTKYNL